MPYVAEVSVTARNTSLVVSCVAIILSAASRCWCAEPVVERIISDWRERREGSSTVEYALDVEVILPKGALTVLRRGSDDKAFPPQDHSSKATICTILDFDENRVRIEREGDSLLTESGLERLKVVLTFDGERARRYFPPAENLAMKKLGAPTGYARLEPGPASFCDPLNEVLLLHHGSDPVRTRSHRVVTIYSPAFADDYRLVGEASEFGRSLQVIVANVPPNETLELWVNTARGSAIERIVRRSGDTIAEELSISHVQDGGMWFPSEIDFRRYAGPQQRLRRQEKARVTLVRRDFPAADRDFDAMQSPGTDPP